MHTFSINTEDVSLLSSGLNIDIEDGGRFGHSDQKFGRQFIQIRTVASPGLVVMAGELMFEQL